MVLPNLPGLHASLGTAVGMVPDQVLYNPALGLESEREYRRRNLDLYEASQYANALDLPASTHVLSVPMTETLPAWHTRYYSVNAWDSVRLMCLDEDRHGVPC